MSIEDDSDNSPGMRAVECAEYCQHDDMLAEIERLQALVKLASDAYENGGEDDCCVACAEIAKAVAAEQRETETK